MASDVVECPGGVEEGVMLTGWYKFNQISSRNSSGTADPESIVQHLHEGIVVASNLIAIGNHDDYSIDISVQIRE